VGDADYKDYEAAAKDSIDDNVILAGMDAAQFRAAFELLRAEAARILRQQVEPADNALPDRLGQVPEFLGGSGCKLDAIGHAL
jgi:hypothetical protein